MNPSPETLDSKIIMQGIHVELTEAMKTSIREKFAVLLRHNARIIRLNVRLHRDQKMGNENHFTATGQVEIGGPDLVASVDGKEAYAVLDALVEKLDKLVRERHDRRKDRRRDLHDVEIDANLPKVS